MYRILKVCRSAIKETELTILNIKGKGKGDSGKKSNTTEESYYYNQLFLVQ